MEVKYICNLFEYHDDDQTNLTTHKQIAHQDMQQTNPTIIKEPDNEVVNNSNNLYENQHDQKINLPDNVEGEKESADYSYIESEYQDIMLPKHSELQDMIHKSREFEHETKTQSKCVVFTVKY